jgi:DNA-binding MarR family transcriptional regulator
MRTERIAVGEADRLLACRRMKVPSSASRPSARTFPRVSYLVKELERALRARIDEILRPFELTAVQYTALSVLSLQPGMCSAHLARRSFVSPQAANEMVSVLERRGLIRRHGDKEGGRALCIFLTASGERTLARCDLQVDALEVRFLAAFTGPAETQFREMLKMGRDAVRVEETVPARSRRVARG